MPITDNDVREGLSYAYFYALATRAGYSCQPACRTADSEAVDVFVKAVDDFEGDAVLTDVLAQFQLKATSTPPEEVGDAYAFRLLKGQYDKLRRPAGLHAIPLVLLILPRDSEQWLSHDEEGLTTRKCAYWVSLRNAPANDAEKPTIHVPKQNVFSVTGLKALMARFSRLEEVNYGDD